MMANKYTDRELMDFNYTQSDKVNLAEQQKAAAEQALKDYGGYNFNYGRQADYDKAMDAILNRKAFSYDLNGDMLYQQYKDNYINQGKLAMMDTMGQAAAMTGGYGNSYAATVGNQAYQASLQNLNNIIPDLYSLALQSYNAEGDRLATNLNALGSDRQLAQSEYDTKYNADMSRLTSDRDYYADNYNNERSFDYGSQYDNVTENNEAYWNEYNAGYQAEQDAIANQLARDQLNETIRANQVSEKLAQEQWEYSQNSGSATYADKDIPQYILDKLAGFDNDFDIDDYLYSLESNGTLTNAQAKELAATYYLNNTIEYDGNTYLTIDDGGINGLWGVDNNAKVKIRDADGNYIEKTMKQLYNDKIAEGMSKKDAKEWVKTLQGKLGV